MTEITAERFHSGDLKRLNQDIKAAFTEIRMEFEDHLDTINENTAEIQSNYEYICKLDSKIDKLGERLDTLQLFLKAMARADDKLVSTDDRLMKQNTQYTVQELSEPEKKVFMALYTAGNEPIGYPDLAKKLRISKNLIREYITNLIEKGVPLMREYRDNIAHYKLKKDFIEQQAKHNILKIDQKTLLTNF